MPTETFYSGAGVMESVTFEDVAAGLIQEWELLDDARRNLYRYGIPGTCRTLAPRGTPPCKPRLASQVGPREELRAAERGILCAMGMDWESQPKPKESTATQDILEENSSHDLQM
ncbi:zinc finger protein 333, partial [Sturnira hondurensis]|uniref:zinc finger protein 333 n=1 Tax=Sturnira hondurensis TaxID=192404 RepID=UPI001879C801